MTEQTQRDRMWNEWGMLFEIPENEAAAKVGFYAGFNAGQRELKHRIAARLENECQPDDTTASCIFCRIADELRLEAGDTK